MTLSTRLRGVDLVLKCKYCDHPITKKGTWFWTAYRFECERCKRDVRITYSDKVALFAEHAHLGEGDRCRRAAI
jgi:hypothetical protein